MRVLVMADSHGGLGEMRLGLRAAGEIDCAIHLGDFASDARALERLADVPVYAVRGNCDFGADLPAETVVTLGGVRLFAAHGHTFDVRFSVDALAARAEALGCAVALYGHTHVSMLEAQGKLLILNPGSPKLPRGGRRRSVAVLSIEAGEVFPQIVTF